MKIQLLSDLHLEFKALTLSDSEADAIVLAGDIDIGTKGLDWARATFPDKPIIYVLGNHEYYRHTYPKLVREFLAAAKDTNVHVLENQALTLGDVTFHGATLWTDFELFGDPRIAGHECQQSMTDFKKIRREPGYSKLRSIDVALIHKRSLAWLKESVAQSTSRHNVIVTHHAPSLQSVPAHYKDDMLTAAYASNLKQIITDLAPDAWLHGHLHNSSDYWIKNCRVVCNPRGYPHECNPDFDPALLIEVGQQLAEISGGRGGVLPMG